MNCYLSQFDDDSLVLAFAVFGNSIGIQIDVLLILQNIS